MSVAEQVSATPTLTADRTPPKRPRARRGSRNVVFWFAVSWMALIALLAVLAPILPIRDFADTSGERLQPIGSWPEILGTDMLGRSTLSRVIYGARVSLTVAFTATLIALILGLILGLLAAYLRGAAERIIDIISASVLAFPGLVLLLALVAVLPASTLSLSLALGTVATPAFIRLVKANAMAQVNREYVTAAKAMGARLPRILIRELLPNTLVPLVSLVAVSIAIAIIAEGSLSFLGFGIAPPHPSWGGLIAEGKDRLGSYPGLVLVPCVVMFLTVFSSNTIGDRLRGYVDVGEAKL
ncbi:ABC transporter permease [Microbacterium album]|uniref:Peptide ABC transporter permease n=1 Tax=Microbacterium album TaxID=2053191 RepID=A0A917ID88_9MICO|nr:ABC transporter permease [Microbacterium album]GGH41033.1 peptide ABC transporter permease [Microbacterium album]